MHQPRQKKQQEHREKCQGSCILQEERNWAEAEDAEGVEPGEEELKTEILWSFCV